MTEEERKSKKAAYMREWYARNPEYREREKARKSTPEKREAARARAKEWYRNNRERALASAKERYEAQPKKGRPTGENHHLWKGDNVSYSTLHRWVVRYRGRPQKCEFCGTTEAKVYDWANKDHQYKRNLDDWLRLCRSCHRNYDYENGLSEKGHRWKNL